MAWRDGRASGKRLLLFMASIILGIAAVVSIQSFSKNLEQNITLQSKSLMGADFLIDSNHPPNEKVQLIIDSLGGADGREINFPSMAVFLKNGATKLVEVRGIDGEYPFYGTLETKPESAANEYQKLGGALVDATLMLQYDINPKDSIKIGNISLPIVGSLVSAPGSGGISASVAPPVLIPNRLINATGLVQIGSRVEYIHYFVAKPDQDLDRLDKIVDPLLDAENADLDTHISRGRQLGRRYENFGKFLNLVAFIALLLGCVGIASSVHIYIKEKLNAIAVLKCLGATRKQTFLIYLIQIAVMGLVGGLIGTTLGILLQQLFPLFLQDLIQFDVELRVTLQPIVTGLVLGVFMSLLFALSPLLSTWYVSPLQVLRIQENVQNKSKKANILVLLAIMTFIFIFSFWLLDNLRNALAFVVGILVVFSILAGTAILFMKMIKKYFPSSWSFSTRQSLLNLFRPNNQTMVLLVAIGVGTFLISTLYFTKDILLAKTSLGASSRSPNIILIDVQTEEREAVAKIITEKGLSVLDNIPIITMRIHRIKGRLANTIRQDSTSTINQWILNHEFRVTYRDSLNTSETLDSGKFTPEFTMNNGLIPISLSDNVARDAQVVVGDSLTFNVQGVLMQTVVGSIRAVDWGRMQLNFSIVFPKGVLEKAPQFYVLTTNAPDEKISAHIQKELVRRFPTVSIIDLRQLLTVIQGILDKISWVINFMAFFSILTGVIVLIGSVRTSKYQRIKENVLLRTLGAQSRQILNITALEYLYLGVIGSAIGILLSLISSQLLAVFVFKTVFTPSWVPFLVVFPGITLLVLLIGLSNSRSVIHSPPLEVLRKETT
ncbi:MAG: FtsX-like permease family protein [Flavobacteriaceae bacterium]